MGIIDDYLNPSKESDIPSTIKSSSGSDSIINQYLYNDEKKPLKRIIIDTTPKPPISGFTKEQSDELNSRPEIKGGVNPRSQDSLSSRASGAIYDTAKEGLLEAGKGLSQVLSSKPATGVGNMGLGLLTIASSPLEGVGNIVSNITGSEDIGRRAGLLSGLIAPVSPSSKIISKNLPKNKALNELVDKITSGGREPERLVETIQAMRENPRIGPVDRSPAVLNMAQKLFTTEGDAAKNYLHAASSNRIANSPDIINQAYDQAAGIPVNAVNKLQELSMAAKRVGQEQINPAIVNAKPVDISPIISHIDDILKPGIINKITGESTLPFPKVKQALSNVKSMIANEKEQLTDPQALHTFQSALRKEAEARLNSADGGERQLGHSLMAVRNKVVDAIDKASPQIEGIGSYKPALNNFRDEKHIAEAFHDAYNGVLTNSKKLENRPEFTKGWFNNLTPHEKEAAIEGIRTRIDTEIGVAKNPALAGTSLAKSDFNKAKMEAVLGKEETDKLLKTLDYERAISNTHNKIIEGSQTEMRRAADEAIAMPEKNKLQNLVPFAAEAAGAMSTGYPAVGTLAYQGLRGVNSAVHAIKTKLAKERNLQLAKMALPVEGPKREELIRQLESFIPGPKQSLLSRAGQFVSRLPISP